MKFTGLAVTMHIVLLFTSKSLAMTNIVPDGGNLVDRIDNSITIMPAQWRNLGEGTTYSDPTNTEATNFRDNVFAPLYQGQFETAATNALTFEYRLVAFTDNTNQKVYYILERDPTSMLNNYWGTYIFDPNPDRGQLIIQSPHPSFDTHTGRQGAYTFRETGAGFFFMSGAHRCNNPTPSGCDGFSSVCGNTINGAASPQEFQDEGDVFRVGDVAHNANTLFQYLNDYIQDDNPGYYTFIQLHGFSQNLDPHVILSNGRDEGTTPPVNDLLSTLRTQLINEWDNNSGEMVSLIIEVAHDDPDHNFNSLLGTTNTQGRYINGSVTPCTSAATQNTGNFVHIEMAKKNNDFFLRDDDHWDILVQALINTYITAPLPVGLIDFSARFEQGQVKLSWSTAWELQNDYFQVQRSFSGTDHFEELGYITGSGASDETLNYHWMDNDMPPYNGFVFYRLKQVDFNGQYVYSEVVSIKLSSKNQSQQALIWQNHGIGSQVSINPSNGMTASDALTVAILTEQRTRVFYKQVPYAQAQDTLRTTLPKLPPGVYLIILKQGQVLVKERFLRL